MTLIVGVISPYGIVVGSDSQTTSQTTVGVELKRTNKQKPKVIEMGNRCLIFAGAGHVSVLQEVENKINILLQDCSPEQGLEAVREKIDNAIYNIMNNHIKKHSSMFGHLINMPSGDFLFGSWKNDNPLLCHFSLDGSSEEIDDYIALGSGLPYAEVLLKDSYRKDMNLDDLKRLVYSVIKDTEDVDNYVGGDIHIKIINSTGNIETVDNTEISALEEVYKTKKDIEKKMNKNWQELAPKIINLLDEEEKKDINKGKILSIPKKIERDIKPTSLIEIDKKEVNFDLS